MANAMQNALETIQKLVPQLNASTDEASRIISDVEKFLEKNNVGIEAKGLPSPQSGKVLCYTRVSGKFRIAVRFYEKGTDVAIDVRPWLDCTRDDKLATFPCLTDLLVAISDRAKLLIEKTPTVCEMWTDALQGE